MRWYRSLYWRIALGVVAFLAAMLVVQAVLFVWAVSESGRSAAGQSPARIGRNVAFDLASLLEREPDADLERYIREQYASYEHPFFVMLDDGRVFTSGSASFPEALRRMARARLEARELRTNRPEGFRPERGFGGRTGESLRTERFERGLAPIIVGGRMVGVVVVPLRAPFRFLLGRYLPTLTLVAVGVLVLGAVLTSVMIFGPARRRLRALESAARNFGAGDLSARAPDRGGDEIAAVASAFNTMADDLAARAQALATSDRLRRQLLADVSHELNTPMTAMRGYIETLSMPDMRLDEATRARYLRIVGDETARLEKLIGELLELARLEGGGGALQMGPIPVDDLFARVVARHERAASDAGVAIETSVEPEAATVYGDRDRLEQALQNLAANAIRYAPHGTSVRLAARAAPPMVALSVEDRGLGIEPEHLPHLFDRFYKADGARPYSWDKASPKQDERRADPSGGSGLGLSIVKAIVERHGGRIAVRSRPGSTVFEATLPMQPI